MGCSARGSWPRSTRAEPFTCWKNSPLRYFVMRSFEFPNSFLTGTHRKRPQNGTKSTKNFCVFCAFLWPIPRESRILIQASRLVLGVFGANVFLNLGNLHSLIMHFPRIEGDVLTDIACGTVLVPEAKQIVLMSEIHHASAEAG